ncbi:MAG TPA: prepilin-type N-terminal cleavage/methylation domain-containing protein [Solirubrobacterales bacterium]|nr:prepilin-type N-terminal cleavage/methylation domain-containing protein [Solirubrobacterales bacterium]
MGNLTLREPNNGGEAGFTLIELLVVMLILGVLAAVALPSFFDQVDKGHDAKAKEAAHDVQVTMESCSTENNGKYTNCAKAQLLKLEPALNGLPTFTASSAESGSGYTISVKAKTTEHTFEIKRKATGVVEYPCSPKATGGCPASKSWK